MAGPIGTAAIAEVVLDSMDEIRVRWTSDAVMGWVGGYPTDRVYNGKIAAVHTIPDSGATAPADNYDVSLYNEDGIDVLCGAGLNRDTATQEVQVDTATGAVCESTLELRVQNAGTSNGGTVVFYLR